MRNMIKKTKIQILLVVFLWRWRYYEVIMQAPIKNDVITTDIAPAGIHLLNYQSLRHIVQPFSFLGKSTGPFSPFVYLAFSTIFKWYIRIKSLPTYRPHYHKLRKYFSLKLYFKYLEFYFTIWFHDLHICTICTLKHNIRILVEY